MNNRAEEFIRVLSAASFLLFLVSCKDNRRVAFSNDEFRASYDTSTSTWTLGAYHVVPFNVRGEIRNDSIEIEGNLCESGYTEYPATGAIIFIVTNEKVDTIGYPNSAGHFSLNYRIPKGNFYLCFWCPICNINAYNLSKLIEEKNEGWYRYWRNE